MDQKNLLTEAKKLQVISRLSKEFWELENSLPKEIFDTENFYFAGGCIYSIWNGKPPKDYDIFCTSKAAVDKLKKWFEANPHRANFTTENAITMGKYQFILKYIGKPEVEVAKFDFKHNCCYFHRYELKTLYGYEFLDSKKLVFNSARPRDVLNIVTRIPKFIERGMEISQKEILEILEVGTRPTRLYGERTRLIHRMNSNDNY